MPTDPERLKATLNELLAELSDVDQLDAEQAIRLRGAVAEIQAVIQKRPPAAAQAEAAPPAAPSGLIDRLGQTALRLEESHPDLSSAIGNLAGMLGQMGF